MSKKSPDLEFGQRQNVNEEIESLLSKFMKNVSELAEQIFFSNSNQGRNFSTHSDLPYPTYNITVEDGPYGQDQHDTQDLTIYDQFVTNITFIIPFLSNIVLLSIVVLCINRHLIKLPLLNTLIKVLLSWIFFICISPLQICLFVPILCFRSGLQYYLKGKYNGDIFLAQPLDACWAFESFASSSTCIGLYVIEGQWDMNKILKRFEQVMELKFRDKVIGEVQMYERMRSLLVNFYGFTCWQIDRNFELKKHVKLIHEQFTGSQDKSDYNQNQIEDSQVIWSEKKLFAELAALQDIPISQDISPWEILIVPNYIPNEHSKSDKPHYCIVFRYNHCLMDGVSAGNALHSAIADKPFKLTVDPIDPLRISKFNIISAHILAFFTIPYTIIKNLSLIEFSRFHSLTRKLKGNKTIVWSRPLNIKTLKEIKNVTKTSIFAVLISSFGGALRKLFIKYGDPIPNVITSAPPVAILPYPDRRPRNRFSIVLFPIEIGWPKILDRLSAANRASRELASSTEILANYYVMQILGLLPLPFLKILGPLAHATMSLSNIPGPAEKVHIFEGDTLVDIGAWIPIKNSIGIGVALFSYANRVRITVITDEASIPNKSDASFLTEEFENEMKEMTDCLNINGQNLFL